MILHLLLTFCFVFWTSVGLAESKPTELEEEKQLEKDGIATIKGKERSLTLPLGISKVLDFPFEVGPIYVTDSTLFNYQRLEEKGKRSLQLIAQKPGITDMTIHDTKGVPQLTYIVRVTREDLGQVMSQLEDLLGDIEGLKIRPLGGTVVLDGDILLPKDMLRIIRVIDAVKDRDPKAAKEVQIRNLATVSKTTLNIIAERIEKEIGSPEITVKVINGNLFMEGVAEGDYEAQRAFEIAKSFLPEALVEQASGPGSPTVRLKASGGAGGLPQIFDFLRIRQAAAKPPSQDIKITMNYVELKNDYLKNFNFSWKPLVSDQSSVGYNSAAAEFTASLVATISSLFPKLSTAKSHGHARILKQETIIVKDRSPEVAVIESSIQVYSPVTNEKGERSLQPIDVQNFTKVKAAILQGTDSIDLGIQISLNTLLGSDPPQIAKNSIQTQVTIKNGDSAALGGHGIDEALANYNRTPTGTTGSGSPIFNLQRSKDYVHTKQQYVIFVTPEIIRTAAAGTEDITRKFRLNAGEK